MVAKISIGGCELTAVLPYACGGSAKFDSQHSYDNDLFPYFPGQVEVVSEVVAAKIGARIADKPLLPEVIRTASMRLFSERCGQHPKLTCCTCPGNLFLAQSNKQH